MDEFNWEEIEVALAEQAGLEHKMFQLNGITEVLESGNVNRELAQLAIDLDSDWFSVEHYPIGSFTGDYSSVNHEVLMANWGQVALKLSSQLSGVSLRVALMVAGAVIWLISRVRKKMGGDDSGSKTDGKSGSSSGGSGGSTVDPVQHIREQYNALKDLAAGDMTRNRSITTALGNLETDNSSMVRSIAGRKNLDWANVTVQLTELVNAAENIISVAERQSDILDEMFNTSTTTAKYNVPKTSGKDTLHLVSDEDTARMLKSFNHLVKELSRDINGQLVTESYCRTVLDNTVGKQGLDAALLSPFVVPVAVAKNNAKTVNNLLTGEIELMERSPTSDVRTAVADILRGKYSQRGRHIPKDCDNRSVAVADWVKDAPPARRTGKSTSLASAIVKDNFLSAYREFGKNNQRLGTLENNASSLRDKAKDALAKLEKQTDSLFLKPLLTGADHHRGTIAIQLSKSQLSDLLPNGVSHGEATRLRGIEMQLDPALTVLARFAMHNKKGLLNFASNLCLDRVTKTCKYISDEITYAEYLQKELPKIKSAN